MRVRREAGEAGVNHIDTSDFYGPHLTNRIIKQALHPYTNGIVIITKVGARHGNDESWTHALLRQELIDAVHDNLRNQGLDHLDVVNLRVAVLITLRRIDRGTSDCTRRTQTAMALSYLGLSHVTMHQLAEGKK